MAEIYKQQIEHNASGGTMLRSAPFKNYYKQGMQDVEEGFRKLDQELQYLGDKELAAKMEAVAQEASSVVDSWQDFNTDGRNALKAQISDMWDRALAETPLSAQKRFASSNPEAKKIFELKYNEKILKKAHDQVYNERRRDISAYSDIVANVRDTTKNEQMLRAALEDFNRDLSGVLNVEDLSKLVDDAGHDMVEQTISQAIIEERDSDAEYYLTNPFYTRFLGPSEKSSLQRQLISLRKSMAEDKAAGGDTTVPYSMLRAGYDAAMMTATTDEQRLKVDEDYTSFLDALKNNKPLVGLTINGRPFSDFLTENALESATYWDSLSPMTKQLAVDKFESDLAKVYGSEYKDKQSKLLTSLNNVVTKYSDGEYIDFSKMDNNTRREIRGLVYSLRGMRNGMPDYGQKLLGKAVGMVDAEREQAGKAISAQLNSIQQNMAGFTAGKTFLGGGNITEQMIRKQQAGEEAPSVIGAIVQNKAYAIAPEMAKEIKAASTSLEKVGFMAGTGRLAKNMSDFAYLLGDNGSMNASDFATAVGSLMEQLGEVDKNGKLKVPQANSYRFMSYMVPIFLTYISVVGNEQDLKDTGIIRDAINEKTTVDLVYDLQDLYEGVLDEPIQRGKDKDIKESDFYNMLMIGLELAKRRGLVDRTVQPNETAITGLAGALEELAVNEPATAMVPAKNSGARKRIEEKTKDLLKIKG